jgi:hypothetical protein
VTVVVGRWTGDLTTQRADWTFAGSKADKAAMTAVLDGIATGALVVSAGC